MARASLLLFLSSVSAQTIYDVVSPQFFPGSLKPRIIKCCPLKWQTTWDRSKLFTKLDFCLTKQYSTFFCFAEPFLAASNHHQSTLGSQRQSAPQISL